MAATNSTAKAKRTAARPRVKAREAVPAYGLPDGVLSFRHGLNPVQTTNAAYQPTHSERPNDDAVAWPFRRVSYRRYKYLMDTMPPAMRDRAFTDIDSHFEILLEKWERSFRNHQERKAA